MRIVYVTCKNISEARRIAQRVIKKKLAVCVNIFPSIFSVYRWKGKIEEGKETVLIIKTSAALLKELFSEIKKIHSYKSPEIISWKIEKTTPEIANWFKTELS